MTKKKSKKRISPAKKQQGEGVAQKKKKTQIKKKSTKRAVTKSAPSRKTKKRASRKSSSKSAASIWKREGLRYFVSRISIIAIVLLLAFTAYLDVAVRKQFEGQKWALPAHVYTRPMELYAGQKINPDLIQAELEELGYQAKNSIERVGSYLRSSSQIQIHQREFRFWDGLQPQQKLNLNLTGSIISSISVENELGEVESAALVRLEPRLFGSVSPLSHEDRALLKLDEVPQSLIDALISIEDQQYYSHFGINPYGIARAMVSNVVAGRMAQGGSTLTQQLIKNYYLSSERTIKRKFTEMIMAMLLELHYSKEEILQAYLNEVFLSQAGNRAIHGFSLGALHFFGRPLHELELSELAMLAGIIKGPSGYNPLRYPERAKKRRDLVLKTMHSEGYINEIEYTQALATPLMASSAASKAAPLSYPSFMGFLRENLKNEYQQQDILTDGLQIYTTLNPRIQSTLESTVASELSKLEKTRSLDESSLQVAAVVIRTDNGEVAAMVGDRKASYLGFNRALHARRPVGSLLKPFVFLSALEQPQKYNLATRLDDLSITVSQRGSADWAPQNYDGKEHGPVMLIDALSRSYNMATVQLGMEVGLPKVANTVRRLGYDQPMRELPSMLLGAVPMSVLDVGQLYLSVASGGFKTPIKGIRSVLSNDEQPLERYALSIEQVVEPQINNLITYALQDVVRNGTGRAVLNGFRYDYGLAGKTGTTNDYRDSWFAGFSGNYLMVVWVGRDDNKSTGLTGASGAAKLWAKQMQSMPQTRLELPYHEDVIAKRVYYSLDTEQQDCSLSRQLPILLNSLPLERLPCAEYMQYDLDDDKPPHFETELDDGNIRKAKPKKQSFWKRIFG